MQKFIAIKTVRVVLSSIAMTIDMPGLRNLITQAYPGSAVFFITTSGQALGVKGPDRVDLTIDFTPPAARQSFFFAYRMTHQSRFTVGRDAGWFYRKKLYTRVYDETIDQQNGSAPKDYLLAESFVQKHVLLLAGVSPSVDGQLTPDLSKEIALDLARS